MKKSKEREIDWVTTLVPLALIVFLCVAFVVFPENSKSVLASIRYILGDARRKNLRCLRFFWNGFKDLSSAACESGGQIDS